MRYRLVGSEVARGSGGGFVPCCSFPKTHINASAAYTEKGGMGNHRSLRFTEEQMCTHFKSTMQIKNPPRCNKTKKSNQSRWRLKRILPRATAMHMSSYSALPELVRSCQVKLVIKTAITVSRCFTGLCKTRKHQQLLTKNMEDGIHFYLLWLYLQLYTSITENRNISISLMVHVGDAMQPGRKHCLHALFSKKVPLDIIKGNTCSHCQENLCQLN